MKARLEKLVELWRRRVGSGWHVAMGIAADELEAELEAAADAAKKRPPQRRGAATSEEAEGQAGSQLRCPECYRLWSTFAAQPGERCGVRLNGAHWCDGVLEEHQCGGPREACGLRDCEECGVYAREKRKAGAK